MTEAAILLGQNDRRLIKKAMLANIQTIVDIAESEKDSIGFVHNRVSAPTQIWMKFWEAFRKIDSVGGDIL